MPLYIQPTASVPDWYNTLLNENSSGKRLFLLDFNIRDYVFVNGRDNWPKAGRQTTANSNSNNPPHFLESGERLADPHIPVPLDGVYDWLLHHLASQFDLAISFSRVEGLRVFDPNKLYQVKFGEKTIFVSGDDEPLPIDGNDKGGSEGGSKDGNGEKAEDSPSKRTLYEAATLKVIENPPDLSKLLAYPLEKGQYQNTNDLKYMILLMHRLLTTPLCFKKSGKKSKKKVRIAFIIENVEQLAPPADDPHVSEDQRLFIETINTWAHSQFIARSNHMVIMLANDIHQVNSSLHSANSGIFRINLPWPNQAQRLEFLTWLKELGRYELGKNQDGKPQTEEELSRLTAGMNYSELDYLARHAYQCSSAIITDESIRLRKREVLRSQSNDLLEIIEPLFGWTHIGGTRDGGAMSHVVDTLTRISKWLREVKYSSLIPKGMLFVGPPGTGKSLVAQALAKEAGVNMVKLRDIQGSYVGESERNMTRALEVARTFEPVIIFVDEIDQSYGQRASGPQGDSGVSARLFGKLLEFTGDNQNRGKVIWIAASNRPDLIDAAMLRRFDRIVPFLLPGDKDRRDILLNAMPNIVGFRWKEKIEDGGNNDFEYVIQESGGFSGNELEKIVRRALEISGEEGVGNEEGERGLVLDFPQLKLAFEKYRRNRDPKIYELQTLLALSATDFTDYLPDHNALKNALDDDLLDVNKPAGIDWEALQKRIDALQGELSRRV